MHKQLRRALIDKGVPFHGSKYTGSLDDFWSQAAKAYDGLDSVGYLKVTGMKDPLFENLNPLLALEKIKKLGVKWEIAKL